MRWAESANLYRYESATAIRLQVHLVRSRPHAFTLDAQIWKQTCFCKFVAIKGAAASCVVATGQWRRHVYYCGVRRPHGIFLLLPEVYWKFLGVFKLVDNWTYQKIEGHMALVFAIQLFVFNECEVLSSLSLLVCSALPLLSLSHN